MVVSLFTSRIILQALGVEDFGIYNVVGGVVAMMGVLNGAMSVSTQRFLTFELGCGNLIRLKQVFSTCFTIYVFLSILVLLLGETIGLWFLNYKMVIPDNRLVAANWVYQFTLISCINSLMSNPYNAIIIAREKMNIYAYISIVEVALKLIVVYLLLIIPYDRLTMYGALIMSVSILVTMIYRFYCTSKYPESRFHFYWEKALFIRLLSYSGWNLFGSISSLVKGQGLNILLNVFFNPAVNASRAIAYQINTAITQFFTNFYTAVRPQITKYYAQNDLENMFKLVFRSSKYSFYLIYIISLPILIGTPYLVRLWLGQLPEYVVVFTRIIVVISAVDSMATPLMTTAHAIGNIKLYQSIVGTVTILNIPISYLLLEYVICSPVVVFIVSLCLSIICLFLRLWVVNRLVNFPVWRYVKEVFLNSLLIAVSAAIIPLIVYMQMSEGILSFTIVFITCIISSFFFFYFLGLSQGEKSKLINLVKNKLKQ